jgi:NAD(P)-dependent dehydrogenase (short-subunit alcohol dehydrogenase family)/tetratricopeptide (TPR) repeat protein
VLGGMAPSQFGEEWGEAAPLLAAAKELSEQAEKEATTGRAGSKALLRIASQQLEAARRAGNRKGEAGPLLAIAEGQLGAGAHGKALEASAEVIGLLRELGLEAGEAGALQLLAEVHLAAASGADGEKASSESVAALQAAEEACVIFRRLGHSRGEVGAAQTLAKAQLAMRKPRESLQAAMQAFQAAERLGDKELQADTLGKVWKAKFMEGTTDQAAEVAAQQALELYRELKDASGEATMLHALACAQLGGKRPEEATQSAEKALTLFRTLGDKVGEMAVLEKISDIYQYKVRAQSKHRLSDTIETVTTPGEAKKLSAALMEAVALLRKGSKKKRSIMLARCATARAAEQAQGEFSQALRIAAETLALTWGIADEEASAEVEAAALACKLRPEDLEGRTVALLREAEDRAGEAAALCLAAEVRFLWADTSASTAEKAEASLAALAKARTLYQEMGDKASEMAVLDSMIAPTASSSSYEAALQIADDALAIQKELKDARGMAELSHLTVALHLSAGAPGRALQKAQEARRLGREANGTPKVWAGRAIHGALVAQLMRADHTAALGSATELVQFFRMAGLPKGEATTWLMMAEVHLGKGIPEQALRAAKEALSLCRAQGDREVEASVLTAVANAFLQVSRGPEALRAATRAAALLEEAGDEVGTANARTQLAQAHLATSDPRAALTDAAEAVALHRRLGGGRGEAQALQTLAESYLRTEDKNNAMQAAKDAREIFKRLGDKAGEASTLNTMAGILTMAGENEEALKNARASLKGFHEAGDKKGEAAAKETCQNLRGKANRPKAEVAGGEKPPFGLTKVIQSCVPGYSGPRSQKKEAMFSARCFAGQMENKDLAGMLCLVTGASRGVGKGIAEELAQNGAIVYVTGRSAPGKVTDPQLQGTVDETVASFVKLGGLGVSVHADHIQESQSKALASIIASNHGRLDCCVNNAFYFPKPEQCFFNTPLWQQPMRFLHEQAQVGSINHAALTMMLLPCLRRGKGLVVNVSSGSSMNAVNGTFPLSYMCSKSAYDRVMMALGEQVAHYKVHSITLWPGQVRSERTVVHARRWGYRMNDIEYCRFSGKAVATLLMQDSVELAQYTGSHRIISSADIAVSEQDAYRHEGGLLSFTTGGRASYKAVAPNPMQALE